ncbi:MAG TPA: CDP-diacylglycerol--glycerol-3-phosphate 3-phosphatidyltransferase [Acidimicrobiales bacterium]|nr:CDP-diacylglycerol--glycerol-3-phosphate 3-phosphatidyltransferase [Acidimicrobiales bacterium]
MTMSESSAEHHLSFGPSALATPANALTITRLVITPYLLWMIVTNGHSWPALALWITLAVSDGFDGHLARKYGTTRSGAFLDPLADKVLVLGTAWALVAADRFWWVPVAIITVRELGIQALRSYYGRRGLAIEARYWAKVKTVVQEVAIGFALLPLTAEEADWIPNAVLWVAVVLTVVTGVNYVLDGRAAASTMARADSA